MRNPYVIALCVLSFAGVAYATGQIGVTGYPPVPRVLKGGTGINIASDGTFSATGEAVVTGSQPFGNLSSALRGKYLGASGTAVNAGAYKGNSAPTATEFGYLSGVQAPVQGQISSANVRIDTLNNTVITTSTIGNQTVAAATGNAGTATKLETARNINGVAFDGTTPITVRDAGYLNYSGHDHVTPALVNASTATPADSDSFSFFNSVLKKVSWVGIKSTLKTYFDTLYHGLTVTWSEITGKPTFATVATSGNYSDLNGKPAPYTLPTASTIVKGGVMIDGSSIQIDGSGVIHSTVAAGVSSVQEYTGDITLQLSDFPDIVAGLDSKVSQVAFNNRSTAQGTRDTAQDSAIALKAPIDNPVFNGGITTPVVNTSGADGQHMINVRNTISPTFTPAEGDMYTDSVGKIWLYISGQWVDKTYVLPAATADTLGGVKVGSKLSITNGVLDVVVASLGPTGLVTAGLSGNATVRKGFAYIASGNYRATFANISSGISTYASFGNYSGRLIPPAGGKFKWANPVTLANYTTSGGYSVKIPPNSSVTVQSMGDGTYHATATRNLQKTGVDEYYVPAAIASTDDFNRADSATLGSNWATPTGLGVLKIVSNQVMVTTNGVTNEAYWTASDLTNDHCSQVTVAVKGSNGSSPTVRQSATADTSYYLSTASPDTLRRRVAGADTQLVGGTGTLGTTAQGDTLKLCVKGSTITVYRNGSLEYTKTDTGITTGYAGLLMKYNDARLDNWVGSVAP